MILSKILSKIDRYRSLYETRGSFAVVERFVAHDCWPRKLLNRSSMVIFKLKHLNLPEDRPLPDGYKITLINEDDADVADKIDKMARLTPAEFRLRKAIFFRFMRSSVGVGFVLSFRGEVVGYAWAFPDQYTLTFDNYRLINLNFDVPQGVFMGNCYIDIPHRKQGLHLHLVRARVKHFPAANSFYSSTELINEISFHSHLKMGFRPLEIVTDTSFLGHHCLRRKIYSPSIVHHGGGKEGCRQQ